MGISTLDTWVVGIYAVAIFVLAQWVSRERGEHRKNAQDYFLASRALPWWAIGTSLIAANISAEQIIGMSGSGYVIGLGIASYEWMSALTLIIVGKYFLPVFLTNRIYTMPEFLQKRFSPGVRTVMAVFWLGVYVFVNLTAILQVGPFLGRQQLLELGRRLAGLRAVGFVGDDREALAFSRGQFLHLL